MNMRRSSIIGALIGVLLATAVVSSQPINTQIQIAVNQLTTGVTVFTRLRMLAGAYINWGAGTDVNGYGFRDNAGNIEVKNSGGAWTPVISAGGAPTTASYWTRGSEAGLTNESVLGALATGLVINTTTTGVPSAYIGTSCTAQFIRSLSAVGVATCASVDINLDTTGTLGVGRGGTGLSIGTSGGVLAFTGSTTIASSAALTASAIVLGGGAGAVPGVLASLGTTTTLLHGNASGPPTFAAVNLATAEVTGILAAGNGGSANAFFAVSGPAASIKTFTFPNASSTVLTSNAAVTAVQGGTGLAVYAVGDLLQAPTTTTLARLAAVATGNVLISGGVGVVSSWGKVGLTTHITGTLPVANGGTGLASFTTGDILIATAATTIAGLPDVAVGRFVRSGGVGVAPAYSTTIWTNAATQGDLLAASAANTYANIAAVAVGQVLISAGTSTLPTWSSALRISTISLGANLAWSNATPTISSGFGTSPSVTAGTAASFRVDVGTGGTATNGVIGLPTAATGWNCAVENLTGVLGNVMDARTVQIASTTATVTVENQTVSTGAALVWTASDILKLTCTAF